MKTSGGATTIYHYDQWGQVIAESDASGTILREYAYTRPEHGRARLAIIDTPTAAIYSVVPDHLGTPVMITNLAGAPVWSADQLPFGQTTPLTSNTISQHLRFPGQYSDTESGLHYNWHRYYDPNTGRYLRVDPIGVKGGKNPYRYGDNNPFNVIDIFGLKCEIINEIDDVKREVEGTVVRDWDLMSGNYAGFGKDKSGQERVRLVCNWKRTFTDIFETYVKRCYRKVQYCDSGCDKPDKRVGCKKVLEEHCDSETLESSHERSWSQKIIKTALIARHYYGSIERAEHLCKYHSLTGPPPFLPIPKD